MNEFEIKNKNELVKRIKEHTEEQLNQNPVFENVINLIKINPHIKSITEEKIDNENYKYKIKYDKDGSSPGLAWIREITIDVSKDKINIYTNVEEKYHTRDEYRNIDDEKLMIPTKSKTRIRDLISIEGQHGIVTSRYIENATEMERYYQAGAHPKYISRSTGLTKKHYDEFGIEHYREQYDASNKIEDNGFRIYNNDELFLPDSYIIVHPETKINTNRESIDVARVVVFKENQMIFNGASTIDNYNFPGRGLESLNTHIYNMGLNSSTAHEEIKPKRKEEFNNSLSSCTEKQKEGLLNKWWEHRDKYHYSYLDSERFVYINDETQHKITR